jgi:hypothetical protein
VNASLERFFRALDADDALKDADALNNTSRTVEPISVGELFRAIVDEAGALEMREMIRAFRAGAVEAT